MNYFPSRFDPVRHAEQFPFPQAQFSGKREKAIIAKENNFSQPVSLLSKTSNVTPIPHRMAVKLDMGWIGHLHIDANITCF